MIIPATKMRRYDIINIVRLQAEKVTIILLFTKKQIKFLTTSKKGRKK